MASDMRKFMMIVEGNETAPKTVARTVPQLNDLLRGRGTIYVIRPLGKKIYGQSRPVKYEFAFPHPDYFRVDIPDPRSMSPDEIVELATKQRERDEADRTDLMRRTNVATETTKKLNAAGLPGVLMHRSDGYEYRGGNVYALNVPDPETTSIEDVIDYINSNMRR